MSHDTELWVISPDPADKLVSMREKLGLEFPTLMDPDLALTKSFGLLNEKNGEMPHPAAILIDKGGVVQYVRVDEDFRVRPEPAELLEAAGGLPQAD